jgi:hypothetical protein
VWKIGEMIRGIKAVRVIDWRSVEDIERGHTSLNYVTRAYPSVSAVWFDTTT